MIRHRASSYNLVLVWIYREQFNVYLHRYILKEACVPAYVRICVYMDCENAREFYRLIAINLIISWNISDGSGRVYIIFRPVLWNFGSPSQASHSSQRLFFIYLTFTEN